MTTEVRSYIEKELERYKSTTGKFPAELVLTPLAAVVLALKEPYGKFALGVPICCRVFSEQQVVEPSAGSRLGILVVNSGEEIQLRSCSLS